MKTARVPLIVIVLAVVCGSQARFAAGDIRVRQPTAYEGPDFLPGQIIVKFSPGVSEGKIAEINEKAKAKVAYTSRFAGFKVLTFPEAIPPQAMVNIYAKNPNVEYAELNYIAHTFMVPDDDYYGYQWHLDNATYGGIGMEQAWDISTGSGVIVAVVDTGVRSGGPDGVGTIIAGWDFVNSDDDPTDDEGHGTHVAGTIRQNTNNSTGVAGVAYDCSIMAVKVLDAGGSGSYAWIADGVHYATDHGAKVINMSLGGRFGSATLENAVAYAYNHGVTIVCASGNNRSNRFVSYPAAYDAYCIAVGATRYDEQVAYYSNCGSSLDLTAPGGDMTVDQNGDGYADGVLQETFDSDGWGYWFYQGTSMAAPHVSGVAALLIAKGVTGPDSVRSVLQSTAKDKGPAGWDSEYGYGIVDAAAALNSLSSNQAPTASFTYTTTGLTCNVDASGSSDPDGTIVSYAWDFGDNTTGTGVTASHTYAAADTYTVTLTVTDNDGAVNTTSQDVTVTEPASNQPPTASFTCTTAELTCTVDASTSSDPDGMITSYAWDFGDGATATGVTASHAYSASGTYTVTLTVTDDDDAVDTSSQQVTVTSSSGGEALRVQFTKHWTEARQAGKNTFVAAFAELKVLDGDGGAVEGAIVTGEWSVAAANIATGITDNGGLTVLRSDQAKAPRNGDGLMFVLTITNVEKSGCTYDPDSPDVLEIPWP